MEQSIRRNEKAWAKQVTLTVGDKHIMAGESKAGVLLVLGPQLIKQGHMAVGLCAQAKGKGENGDDLIRDLDSGRRPGSCVPTYLFSRKQIQSPRSRDLP